MEHKILFVDDDPNILSALTRQFHGKYRISTADSGKKGLELIAKEGPFEVIVSDFKMPGMNGDEFLEQSRVKASTSIRMLLSGQADMEGIANVINKGNIFRFLTKPCPPDLLLKNIDDAVEQYRLMRAEKELLEKTLSGSIKMLIDILSVISPTAFGRALRLRASVKKFAEITEAANAWQLEVSALLSQIGCVAIAEPILHASYTGTTLTPDEFHIFQKHPQTGHDMIAGIPRLENVAAIILYQNKNFNGTGFPEDEVAGEKIPYGARLLKIVSDYDALLQSGRETQIAINVLTSRSNSGWYDPDIAEKFCKVISVSKKYKKKLVTIEQLDDTMILAEDLISIKNGAIIGHKGQIVTKAFKVTLINFKRGGNVGDTLHVVIPIDE